MHHNSMYHMGTRAFTKTNWPTTPATPETTAIATTTTPTKTTTTAKITTTTTTPHLELNDNDVVDKQVDLLLVRGIVIVQHLTSTTTT